MGKILSVVYRKANRFNIENRAHKVISRDKPVPAPMHAYAKEQLDRIVKDHPGIIEQHRSKDQNLDNRLKNIYVTSEDPSTNSIPKIQDQDVSNLPHDRHSYEDPEYGYYEPAVIPKGKLTLKQAVEIIINNQTEPEVWTIEKISKEYHLSSQHADDIVKYFRAFEVYIPAEANIPQKVAAPHRDSLPPRK